MSSRKSSSSGAEQPYSRYAGRTPLRNLNNDIRCLSSSNSGLRSKEQLTAEALNMTMGDIPISDKESWLYCSSPTKLVATSPPTTDMTTAQTSCGLEDVTFKSFICAGGEVEISNSSHCPEESIALPQDQDMSNNNAEDTVFSHSMTQFCGDHEEHPYFKMKELYPLDVSEPCLFKVTNCPSPSGDLDEKQDSRTLQRDDGETGVTLKSFVCEEGEVEESDTSRIRDDTIPLPQTELSGPSQDEAVSLTHVSDDCDQLCQVKHAGHPYSSTESDSGTCSETSGGSNKPADGLTDVTFKSFHCTGGEIEIFDDTVFTDESVPLQAYHDATASILHDDTGGQWDDDLHGNKNHFDHPYCTLQDFSSPPCRDSTLEPVQVETQSLGMIDSRDGQLDGTCHFSEKTPLPEDQSCCRPAEASGCVFAAVDPVTDGCEEPIGRLEKPDADSATDLSTRSQASPPHTSVDASDNEARDQLQEMSKYSNQCDGSAVLSNCRRLAASAESPESVETQQHGENETSTQGCGESTGGKDSALGSSGNGLVESDSEEKPFDVLKVLSECSPKASALPLGLLDPVVRRMSLCLLKACGDLQQDQFSAEDLVLEGEKSLLAPLMVHPAGFWAEHEDSPIPHPLFNSTVVADKRQSDPIPEPAEEERVGAVPPVRNVALIPEGPLQQQLWQMAEFLFLASGKMGPPLVSAPAATTVPPVTPAPAESCSVSVGTSPVKLVDHSLNTSGQFERRREISLVDSCTVTDPLLWIVNAGSLECLPRQEVEQRLTSSMIMVEALVQQLSAARAQQCASAGCSPSDLREKLVQTEHTELSQTTLHRDLYVEALRRISELELDGRSLRNLMQQMQSVRVDMTSLSRDTDTALSNMKELCDIITEDQHSLISHYGCMTSLLKKSKETHMRQMQKVQEALEQRKDMRTQMEEAFSAKEAAFRAMDQLRMHCARERSELEKSLGSQQELLVALKQIYPQQVSFSEVCAETLNSASRLLSQTLDDQSSLTNELVTARSLLQKAAPMLLKLNDKTAAALTARDQAIAEREQLEEEFTETRLNLQSAKEKNGDLNLQVTILTTEMGVLQQKLNEKEEEAGQLGRKVTELSATVSSTLASYTFLEQALAAESTKLQQSWQDLKQAKEQENELETSLARSQQRGSKLTRALEEREQQLDRLQTLSESQSAEIQSLQELCTQLQGVREMNEFLLMENEVVREQAAESEGMLRENLQALRERNIQCEDLRGEVRQLQLENGTLHEELEAVRSGSRTTRLQLEEMLTQAATEITVLLHTLHRLTDDLQATLRPQEDKTSEAVNSATLPHPTNSLVGSVLVALAAEKDDVATGAAAAPGVPESAGGTLFSQTSAFTRVAAATPKQSPEEGRTEEAQPSGVAALLWDLDRTVKELVGTVTLVRRHRDQELQELQTTVCELQVALQAAGSGHEAEVSELKLQLRDLKQLTERGNQALQQKAQDEKTVLQLMTDVQEAQDSLSKYRSDNNDLRKDVLELRGALQQSAVESRFLREELRKAGGTPTHQTQWMEEKLQLLKEVESLKASLLDVKQARAKLLEKAKRHDAIHLSNQQKVENELQILNHMINRIRETLLSLPEVVKNCKQLQQLLEYIG